MTNKSEKPKAGLQPHQGQNVLELTRRILAQQSAYVDHSTEAQAERLLSVLRMRPVTTITAARELDIVHPPSTVRYLRGVGHEIRTQWAYIATETGRKPHRVGEYVLIKEAA